MRGLGGWIAVVVSLLGQAAPVLAQQPPPEARFQVSGYGIEGRVLLRSEDFTRVVSPYVGRGKTAADIERARVALQDTYHNLGHCAVRVALVQPEPKDGMVTFRVSEVPASEVRDCLPAVVLDEPARRSPPAGVASDTAGAATYSYADPREPAAPALKPRGPAAPASAPAAAPRSENVAQPAGASQSVAPATRAAAVDTGQAAPAPGVAVAPYVEGTGARGLNMITEGPAQDPARLANVPDAPAKVPVAAPVVATVEPVKPSPATPAPAAVQAETKPAVAAPVVAAVEPAKPAPPPTPAPAIAVKADAKPPAAPVVAAAEPVKPSPATPAPAAVQAETKPAVAAPVVAAVEPAKPAPAKTAPAAAQVEAKPPVTAPVVAAAGPAKPAPAKPAPVASPVEAKPSVVVAAIEPARPAPASVLDEAKKPTGARSPFVGTAGVIAEPQPATPAPRAAAQPLQPAVVVAQAEPVKPAAAAPAAATSPAEARPPVTLAQAEPAKPAPAKAAPSAPPVEPVAPSAPRFEITRYVVEGNTLLKQEIVDRALTPFSGPGKDFGDVQRALEALQLAYQKEGYGGVEIRLPEQELDKGEVRLRVVEPRIARITVEGNEHFNEANIRRSVPALREGETPNSREIGKGIRLANENPSKQSAVVLRASEREDHLDATIRVADVDPKRYSVSLDNTGNEETHRLRLGLAFQHSNMFNRDHVMTLQAITAPENYNDVQVFGVGYRIPIYSLGDSVDLIAGYSNVDSGTVQDLFVVAGAGAVYAVRYNQNLPRWGDIEHRLSYGLDYRAYKNDVTPVGGTFKLVPDITVHPLSVTYSGAWRAEGRGEFTYYMSLAQNIPGGNDGQDEDFKQVGARFPDGSASYQIFRTGFTYTRPIVADWQIRIRADGQYTDDALVSGEMFGIGGADSVRGFNERYVSNDKGYRTSWELYTPDMAKHVGFDGRLRFLAFYDQGFLSRNKVQPGELPRASLDSAGVGLRLSYKNNLTLRFDVAYVYHDGTTGIDNNGKDGQTKAHFSMAWVW